MDNFREARVPLRDGVCLALACLALVFAGCAAPSRSPTASGPAQPLEPTRFNELQVIVSHNSYKQPIDADLLAALAASNPELAQALDYGHVSLPAQLDLGLRNLELDVFHDPSGGRFAKPQGLRMIAQATPYDAAVMSEPGFKVLHVQDIDFRSHCPLLRDCLAQLSAWSGRNPGHLPVLITINAKDEAIDQPGFASPCTRRLL